MNAFQALGVDDHDRGGVYHGPARTACSCRLCHGRCDDLGGLDGANDSDLKSPAASSDFVVEGMGSGTPLEARSPTSTGSVDMKSREAGEDLEASLAGDRGVVDLGEQNYRRLADR